MITSEPGPRERSLFVWLRARQILQSLKGAALHVGTVPAPRQSLAWEQRE